MRSTVKLVSNLMAPFMECETKEKARQHLDRLMR